MITTGIDKRVKVQQIIENQIPEFLISESPKAVDFLKQYYISQEYQGGPIDLTDNLDQYLKLDNLTPEVVVGETALTSGITTTDTLETEIYTGVGINDSATNKPLTWIKQKEDKVVNGVVVSKSRDSKHAS
mgnify:CR=1 FL=1